MKDYRKNMRLALVCFLLVVVLNFFLPRLLPGNPVAYLTGFSEQDMTPAQVAFYEDALHLNKPLAAQFGFYLRSLLDGTLGYSYKKDAAVSALIGEKIGAGLRELISYHRLTKNKQETEKLIADILAQMQLPSKILAHLPRQISGGEAQRVALARCLLLSPKLLILDEATSMLDVSTQANLLALVKAQMLPNGGSVLFISHDRALTDFYCDTVYAFDEDHRLKEVRA